MRSIEDLPSKSLMLGPGRPAQPRCHRAHQTEGGQFATVSVIPMHPIAEAVTA
jgi:hypothetical protein